MFLNRIKELYVLNNLYKKKAAKLIIMYGKRRVGKTAVLNQFSRKNNAFYIVARQETQTDQLKKISAEAANFFKDQVLAKNPFVNYDALFLYLSKKKCPIIFDEFPYLVASNKALPSILQEYWDKYFSKNKSFIVLCGSSIQMMESLLGYKSPLYGRRTEQIMIEPLNFIEASLFFPKKLTNEKKVEYYGILGGTPAYLLEFEYNNSIKENLINKILQKNTFLSQDVLFVLKEELNEPRNYFSIICSIAKGNTKLGNIINDTGLEKTLANKYLSVLIDLQIVERKVPITETMPIKSRKGIYILKDNYFKFWFRFVFENIDYVEQNKQDKLFDEKIAPYFNQYMGRIYEDIVLSQLKINRRYKNYLFGNWWNRNEEIDIVGVDQYRKEVILGEVKWRDIKYTESVKLLENLKRKGEEILEYKNYKKIYFLAGKKIENKNKLREHFIILDLKDIINNK